MTNIVANMALVSVKVFSVMGTGSALMELMKTGIFVKISRNFFFPIKMIDAFVKCVLYRILY